MVGKQVEFEATQGKTINRIFYDYEDKVLMTFTDGTFCIFYAYRVDYDEAVVEDGNFHLNEWFKHRDELLELGVVSQSQIDRRQAELDHNERQLRESRKQQYEALKAEFESA
jgi:hypothetical protein